MDKKISILISAIILLIQSQTYGGQPMGGQSPFPAPFPGPGFAQPGGRTVQQALTPTRPKSYCESQPQPPECGQAAQQPSAVGPMQNLPANVQPQMAPPFIHQSVPPQVTPAPGPFPGR